MLELLIVIFILGLLTCVAITRYQELIVNEKIERTKDDLRYFKDAKTGKCYKLDITTLHQTLGLPSVEVVSCDGVPKNKPLTVLP